MNQLKVSPLTEVEAGESECENCEQPGTYRPFWDKYYCAACWKGFLDYLKELAKCPTCGRN